MYLLHSPCLLLPKQSFAEAKEYAFGYLLNTHLGIVENFDLECYSEKKSVGVSKFSKATIRKD